MKGFFYEEEPGMTKILTHTHMIINRGNVKHAVRLLASSPVRKNENRFNQIII